jgi:hypothetical protein
LLAGFWKLFWIICIACWRWCAKVSWTLFIFSNGIPCRSWIWMGHWWG